LRGSAIDATAVPAVVGIGEKVPLAWTLALVGIGKGIEADESRALGRTQGAKWTGALVQPASVRPEMFGAGDLRQYSPEISGVNDPGYNSMSEMSEVGLHRRQTSEPGRTRLQDAPQPCRWNRRASSPRLISQR